MNSSLGQATNFYLLQSEREQSTIGNGFPQQIQKRFEVKQKAFPSIQEFCFALSHAPKGDLNLTMFLGLQWARPDLNWSLWLPKPQGYQTTPRARRLGLSMNGAI